MMQETAQQQQSIQPQYYIEEDTISLLDILLVLARNIKLIIITPAIVCIFTIFYILFIASPIYVSTATFMSYGSGGSNSRMMGLASQFGISMPGNNSGPRWSYEEVIESRTMARTLLKHRFDTGKYGPQKELLQILTYGDGEPNADMNTLIINGITEVQEMIKVKKTSSSSSLYKLEISAFEPQLSSDIAMAVMDALGRHQREYNSRKTTEARKFIEGRLLNTKAELEAAEEGLKEFRERNRRIIESPQLQLEQDRLIRDTAVLMGVFTTLKQNLETAKISEVRESDYVVIMDQPEIPLYPTKPQKRIMVILAGFFGIGFGILWAFIKEYSRNTDTEEQEKWEKVKSVIIKNISDCLPRRFRKV